MFTKALFTSSSWSLSLFAALVALSVTDSVQSGGVVFFQNDTKQWLHAVLTSVTIHLMWKSLLVSLSEFQTTLSLPSELEDRICQLIVEHLKHLDSTTARWEDVYIMCYISSFNLNQPPWLYVINVCFFKLCLGLRFVAFVWSLLLIVSQTAWLESSMCEENEISAAQTDLFMRAVRGPFKGFFLLFVANDIASTAGLNTSPLFYSLVVGAGVLGASAQSVVIDFVASLHLLYARPFQSGDCIAVANSKVMTVKDISYKYTRLRAMDGEEMIYPNNLIANSALQNFGSLVNRRRIFSLWKISRDTTPDVLEKLPMIVKNMLKQVDVSDLSVEVDEEEEEERKKKQQQQQQQQQVSDIQYFCGWISSVDSHCYVFELGYILIMIPDFRAAQHRINIEFLKELKKHNIELTSFENIALSNVEAAFAEVESK